MSTCFLLLVAVLRHLVLKLAHSFFEFPNSVEISTGHLIRAIRALGSLLIICFHATRNILIFCVRALPFETHARELFRRWS